MPPGRGNQRLLTAHLGHYAQRACPTGRDGRHDRPGGGGGGGGALPRHPPPATGSSPTAPTCTPSGASPASPWSCCTSSTSSSTPMAIATPSSASSYCRWCKRRGLSMREVYRGGEKCFVDYAGTQPSIIERCLFIGFELGSPPPGTSLCTEKARPVPQARPCSQPLPGLRRLTSGRDVRPSGPAAT
jgi:hypothetical protein